MNSEEHLSYIEILNHIPSKIHNSGSSFIPSWIELT